MKCWTHADTEASGVCPSCGRALCKGCVPENQRLMACSPECLERLETANRVTLLTYKKAMASIRANYTLLVLAGGTFFLFSLFFSWRALLAYASGVPVEEGDVILAGFLAAAAATFGVCGGLFRRNLKENERPAAQ